ncbi:acid phosphatase [Caulobacter sp. KR2-114]|uniref:acid phosphatase n=1 Tax=Caulobacter sp. KR2-114 TaxID=3400912 RepID=UPI003C078250
MRQSIFLPAAALVALFVAAGAGIAEAPPAPYLTGAAAPDTVRILPPAPKVDSARGVADRAVFRATRALKGSPRWTLAQSDANEAVPAMLSDFSCAAGASLTPGNAPKLAAMLARVRKDTVAAVNGPKDLYRRQRPFLIDRGDICIERTLALAASPDYPSGHTTWGWTVGLILAELAPDRAGPILSRARAFGESRVVCGVHNASAIEAGRTNGAALVAALHGDGAFRADLDAARTEMAAARAAGPIPDAGACKAEAALTDRSPW